MRLYLILPLALLSCITKSSAQVRAPGRDCFCDDQYSPVCGTDGKTYRNVCYLNCESSRNGGKRDCRRGIGRNYAGSVSRTKDGVRCRPWRRNRGIYPLDNRVRSDPIVDSNFPDGSVFAAGNKCRNPDRDPDGPWCYTGIGEPYNFGLCDIPRCRGGGGRLAVDYQGECDTSSSSCSNTPRYNRDCGSWASGGYCRTNPGFMNEHCKKSCGLCGGSTSCNDQQPYALLCPLWASAGFCNTFPGFMNVSCKKSCNTC